MSFVVLKFSITFTIFEEFREIGVMKAIGISNFKIRSLYLTKYLMLAVIGAFVGFFMSIPFSDLLLRSVSSNMVLEADNHFLLSVLGAILVAQTNTFEEAKNAMEPLADLFAKVLK